MNWIFSNQEPQSPPLLEKKTPEEALKDKHDAFKTLQLTQFERWAKDGDLPPFVTLLRTEEYLRKICQKEIALKKGPQAPSVTQKLKELNHESWFLQREWRYWQRLIVKDPCALEKGFKQCRSDPRWYMHPILVQDCVNRGGCCSRDCGCCVSRERETSSIGELGIGHCTVECGCCCEARGFELTTEEKKKVEKVFGFFDVADNKNRHHYQYDLCCASTWGLSALDVGFYTPDLLWNKPPQKFQYRLVTCEDSSTVDESKNSIEDDIGEESDSTLIDI